METFFKAVRPDGTDFYTGTIDYDAISGTEEQLPELPGGDCCGPGVYHASTRAASTLIGGSWPCRLFEVTGTPVAKSEHKRGFTTLTVGSELPAYLALGPNGEAVAAVIERASRLTETEVDALDAARSAALDAAVDAALDAAWEAAQAASLDAAWDAIQAVSCAVQALVVRDLISVNYFNTLYGPWGTVIDDDKETT